MTERIVEFTRQRDSPRKQDAAKIDDVRLALTRFPLKEHQHQTAKRESR